ncbi:hypothetical protein HMPREF0724_10257 [Prescottella equi ATCC 33707]|uniref:Uncharacterized protein n=1 Tax=Prescottella equi ATCC 33707 TaxID=525370 RepID=E9SVI9_RHOHA|nr:hypothetical protein HMPREF0724_10257 [Prescottella equi ATCC 33707]
MCPWWSRLFTPARRRPSIEAGRNSSGWPLPKTDATATGTGGSRTHPGGANTDSQRGSV